MAEATAAPVTTTTETAAVPAVQDTLLSKADQPSVSEGESVLDTAGAEEKAAREAENKRILGAKNEDLTPEEQATKASLLKAQAESDTKAAEEARAKGVPEKYDIKAPEGFNLDDVALAKMTPVFKELGITNVQAQGLTNFFSDIMKENSGKSEAQFKEWNEGNIKETMTALGANAKVELAYVAKVKNMFSPETIEALNASGIGNIKSFILDMAKVGKLFSEERLVDDKVTRKPGSGQESREDVAQKLYPTMAR